MITWLRDLFGLWPYKVTPKGRRKDVQAAIKHVEQVTGRKCRNLDRVFFVKRDTLAYSKSLGERIAVLENGFAGDWAPGSIRVATERNGHYRKEVLQHEIAHQVAWDNGLGREHCSEFRGKIWNWR